MYLTTRAATIALDPADCGVLWKSVYVPEQKEPLPVVRGPAYLDGRVFRGTTDCRLLALDAKSGAALWKTKACDPEAGESLSAAPVAWQGLVYIGIAGGDFGVRGRMFAFDAATGREVWRFNTVPVPGEFGADTWAGQSAQTGGGWDLVHLHAGCGFGRVVRARRQSRRRFRPRTAPRQRSVHQLVGCSGCALGPLEMVVSAECQG